MLARKTAGQIVKLHILFVFLLSGNAANCINKTVVYKDLLKIPLTDTLPDVPFERFGNKYYYFGAIYKGSYFQAIQFCNYHGMAVLSIETKEENHFLFEKMKIILGAGEYPFWTSGTILTENHWVWLTTGKPIIYANWFPNQPDNTGNNEKCLEVRFTKTNKDLIWNDMACTVPRHVICETLQASCMAGT